MTVVIVFGLVAGFWRGGFFQQPELQFYDRLVRAQPKAKPADSRIVIVAITDEDIQRLGTHVLSDIRLAEILRTIAALRPATIAVDLFRDLPLPDNGIDGNAELAAVFKQYPNILAIQRLGLGTTTTVKPPQFLANSGHQVGINDFPVDYQVDGTVRRALLLMDDGKTTYYSMSLMAAMLYLDQYHLGFYQEDTRPDVIHLGKAVLHPLESNDGAYVGMDARGYQMLLDYCAPEVFPTFSISEVFDHRVTAADIAGKVVLLGAEATTLKDYLRTPIDGRYPGVLLHAQMVDQLLRGALDGERAMRFWNEWQEALWVLAWTVIGAVLGTWVRPPLVFVPALLACFAALLGIVWLAFAAGCWLPAIAPGAGLGGAALLGTSCASFFERQQLGLLMQLFMRNVSPEIANALWSRHDEILDAGRIRPHRLTATLVFTDLQGYSGMAEEMDPVALMSWLNEYMEAMSDAVFKYHGVVNKFMGDAVMAMFGPPFARESREEMQEDAVNAVRCALEMNRQLWQLNERWRVQGRPTTAMRVGIFTGVVVGGSIGNRQRQEYTVTGDTVNIAARLEGADKHRADFSKAENPCRILVGETTYSLLDEQFEAEQIGSMELHGKKTKVTVYLIRGEKLRPEA